MAGYGTNLNFILPNCLPQSGQSRLALFGHELPGKTATTNDRSSAESGHSA
jgi:hypothetical protein